MTVLEGWEATALLISDEPLVKRLQAPKAPHEYTPWEAVHADISGNSAPSERHAVGAAVGRKGRLNFLYVNMAAQFAPFSYASVVFHRGHCEQRLRFVTLATSARLLAVYATLRAF